MKILRIFRFVMWYWTIQIPVCTPNWRVFELLNFLFGFVVQCSCRTWSILNSTASLFYPSTSRSSSLNVNEMGSEMMLQEKNVWFVINKNSVYQLQKSFGFLWRKNFLGCQKVNTTSATFHLSVLVGTAFIVLPAIKTKQHFRLLVEAELRWQFLLSVQEWRVYYLRSKLKCHWSCY